MYNIYLDNVLMPIAPESIKTKIKGKNKTVDLVNEGEASILKTPGLTEYSFDLLLPSVQYPFANPFQPISIYLELFERLITSKNSFELKIERQDGNKVLFDTLQQVSLESYDIDEDAENGNDVKVKIKLKQFKQYVTKIAIVEEEAQTAVLAEPEQKRETKEPIKSYTVKTGDTLWAICKKNLGDGSLYPEIAALNGIANPNLIFPGQVIKFE